MMLSKTFYHQPSSSSSSSSPPSPSPCLSLSPTPTPTPTPAAIKANIHTSRQTRTAQTDADIAATSLLNLISLHASTTATTCPPSPSYSSSSPSATQHDDDDTDDQQTEYIDLCIHGLKQLKRRLQQQDEYRSSIIHTQSEMKRIQPEINNRLLEISKCTTQTSHKLDQVLDEKEILMRQLLLCRQQLQDANSSDSDSDFDIYDHDDLMASHHTLPSSATSNDTYPSIQISHVTACTNSDSWEPKVSSPVRRTQSLSYKSHLQSSVWDDSIDDDEQGEEDGKQPVPKHSKTQ